MALIIDFRGRRCAQPHRRFHIARRWSPHRRTAKGFFLTQKRKTGRMARLLMSWRKGWDSFPSPTNPLKINALPPRAKQRCTGERVPVRRATRCKIEASFSTWQASHRLERTAEAHLLGAVHALGERSFSIHMVEHEIVMAVAAPLLVLARPFGIALWAWPRHVRTIVRQVMSIILNYKGYLYKLVRSQIQNG